MAADPKVSAGARLERAAFRSYLRRAISRATIGADSGAAILEWVLARQKRYDKKTGGLGRGSQSA